jgi:hypothetical protein
MPKLLDPSAAPTDCGCPEMKYNFESFGVAVDRGNLPCLPGSSNQGAEADSTGIFRHTFCDDDTEASYE